MQRLFAIDVFRGLAIVLMVFFTIMARLSSDLPFLLEHNVPGELRLGDMVLSFFLFASGMSLFFFVKKRKRQMTLVLDSVERIGKILGVGFLFSVFSAGYLFGLDEMVLNAALFPFVLLLAFYSSVWYLVISLVIFLGYLAIQSFGSIAIFDQAYLGGYPGVIFYLPIMLAGLALSKILTDQGKIDYGKLQRMLLIVSLLFILFVFLTPIDKLGVTPSFMLISILASVALYLGIDRISTANWLKPLEYLGKRPLRYWAFMFIFFIIPHTYCVVSGTCPPIFSFSWYIALLISAVFLVLFAILSYMFDKILNRSWKISA